MAERSSGSRREGWSTRFGVILAVTGSAVGLGNFLRFPGLAAQYGGGAFMIPYFVAFFILGLPIAWAEWSLGRYGGTRGYNSMPGVFHAVRPGGRSPYMAVLGLLIPVVIYFFYVNIEAWCLGYAWGYLVGAPGLVQSGGGASGGADASEYITTFAGMETNGGIFMHPMTSSFFFLLICFALNFVLIYRGLSKGIEWFCRWAMPLLVVIALILLVRVLTLGTPDPARPHQSVLNGLGYMWNPVTPGKSFWGSLANPEMWLEAAGQIFFSLSIGFGIIITYASYMRRDDDVALSSVTAAAGNGFTEVALAGLMTIPAAFMFLGIADIQEAGASSFALGFNVLPMVFEAMPGGRFFGFLFFFLLFLAAVTSSLSMLQPAIAFLEEGLGLDRKASVALLGFITAAGAGFVAYFSKGLAALDAFDFWIASFCIYVLATIQIIYYGWVLGVDRGFEELDRGAEIRVPRLVKFIIKYVAPVYLIGVFALWVYRNAGDRIRNMSGVEMAAVGVILMLLVMFALLIADAGRRWRISGPLAEEETKP